MWNKTIRSKRLIVRLIATFSKHTIKSNQNNLRISFSKLNLFEKFEIIFLKVILQNCCWKLQKWCLKKCDNSPWRRGVSSFFKCNYRKRGATTTNENTEWTVAEPTTKRHRPCRTKCLTRTTASLAESFVRSLRGVVRYYSPPAGSLSSFHFFSRFFSFFLAP